MKTYARVVDGIVIEVIDPIADDDGVEVPIEQRFHPDFLTQLTEVTEATGLPVPNGTYDGSVFGPVPPPPEPTDAELRAAFTDRRAAEMQRTRNEIEPLQFAVDMGEDLPGEADALDTWKRYLVALNRLKYPAEFPTPPAVTSARGG